MKVKVGQTVRWKGIDARIRQGEILALERVGSDVVAAVIRDGEIGSSTFVPLGLLTEEPLPRPQKRGALRLGGRRR